MADDKDANAADEARSTLDYVFFDERPLVMFLDFLMGLGLSPATSRDEETFEARLPDSLEDATLERVEAEYDRLIELNRELFFADNAASERNYRMAGLVLHLKDGRASQAIVASGVLSRILDAVTFEEWNKVVGAIVGAVEEPDDRSFCQRVRDGDAKF